MIAENTFADYCGDKRRKAPNIILYNVEQLTYSLNVVRLKVTYQTLCSITPNHLYNQNNKIARSYSPGYFRQ